MPTIEPGGAWHVKRRLCLHASGRAPVRCPTFAGVGREQQVQRAPQAIETDASHHDPAVAVATKLARWLDGRFVDPLLGLLLPGVGDLISGALGVYPILLAWRARAPKALLARMFLNLSIDAVGGAVPVLGDIWDFLFRAHAKNLALLQSRSRDGALQARPTDVLVLIGAVLLFLAALAVPVIAAVLLVRALRG
jgi:hypothetical protein